MDLEVKINETTRKAFFEEIFIKYPTFEKSLVDDFYRYKATGELPNYFGKESAYMQPEDARKYGLMHIHLCLPPATFPRNRPQADRKCRMGDPQNDACLVYVRGDVYENRYSLLAIFNPDAHEIAKNTDVMKYLSRIAKTFRDED